MRFLLLLWVLTLGVGANVASATAVAPPPVADRLALVAGAAPASPGHAPPVASQPAQNWSHAATIPDDPLGAPVTVRGASMSGLAVPPATPVLSVVLASGYLYCYAALISFAVAFAIKLAGVGLRRE